MNGAPWYAAEAFINFTPSEVRPGLYRVAVSLAGWCGLYYCVHDDFGNLVRVEP